MGAQMAETPNPPPPPWPPAGTESEGVFSAHQERWQQQSLEQQLAATREELAAMKQLLDELPGIFERRFAQRMEPLLAHRERLLSETQQLRQELAQLQGPPGPLSLPALPPVQRRQPRLGRALQHAFGLRRSA
jgi:uncharacterized protein (DUF3084 family)